MTQMLMDYYKAIEDSSERMLQAARINDLDSLVRYQGVCTVLIEQLRYQARQQPLRPEERNEKARIMQRILRNDAEIRQLTEPWLTELDAMMDDGPRVLH
jgi:flagellar protein FliT